MILQALTEYYEALLRKGEISAPGWDDKFKVSYGLEINDAGELIDIIDYHGEVQRGNKTAVVPQEMKVPAHVKRSSGVAANFLCDTVSYMIGADEKGKADRSAQCFKACAELHHKILDGTDSPAAKAVLAFFDNWQPAQAKEHPLIKEHWKALNDNANLVFCYDGADGRAPVVNDPACQRAWNDYYRKSDPEAKAVQCLVTGELAPAARTHPAIKGVPQAQSSGASLVSFNADAFCSYDHKQGENAPVSEYAAFAYTTALNRLLADRNHRRIIGDTAVVCWAENAGCAADVGMAAIFGAPEDSSVSEEDISAALDKLSKGEDCAWLDEMIKPEQRVYFLGLAPNSARLSVRFFLRDSMGDFARNIRRHREEFEIVHAPNDWSNLPLWAIARETVNEKSRDKSLSPQLAGELLRAVLTGGRYPATLINGVALRIRAEQKISRGKAAIIKAYYLRNGSCQEMKEVLTVKLNEESEYMPYVLGRLFAVLESVQSDANPGINTTIKDSYFNSACATPAVVFPTLLKLSQKHLQKLSTGKNVFYSKQITELIGKIHEQLPAHMTLPEQGAFEIGYYHQMQKRFEKKN